MDVETGQRAFATNGNGETMALWSNVSTEQYMGESVLPAARRTTTIITGAKLPGMSLRPGSTVDLQARLVMMLAVYPSALRKGKIIGGVTQHRMVQNGSTVLLRAR